MNKNEFNIRHAFVTGLALSRNCTEIIDEIYYREESLYHEAYLKSGFSKDCLKKIFTMKTEDRFNKVAGIVEVCEEKKRFVNYRKNSKKS